MSDAGAHTLRTQARGGRRETGATEPEDKRFEDKGLEDKSLGDKALGDKALGENRRTATRADLLDAVAGKCPSLTRGQAREIFEMALGEMSDALARGESVKLRSFGLFNVREKRERVGRNPRTGVEVPIKPRRVLTFKPSPVLLDQVNGRDAGKSETAEN